MIIRELLVRLGFTSDTSGATQFENANQAVGDSAQSAADEANRAADEVGDALDEMGNGADDAANNVDDATDTMATDMQNLSEQAKSFGVAVAAAFGTAVAAAMGLKEAFDAQVEAVQEMEKRRTSISLTREEYQQLGVVAANAGFEIQDLQEGIADLAEKSFDAMQFGSSASESLALLGVSASDAAGKMKTPMQLFLDVADAFAGMEDGAQKTFIAMDLMSDEGSRFIPVMNQGSAAIREMMSAASKSGAILSDEMVEGTLAANRQWQALKQSLVGVRGEILARVLPTVTSLVEGFAAWLREGDNVDRLLNALEKVAKAVAVAVAGIGMAKFNSLAVAATQAIRPMLASMTSLGGVLGGLTLRQAAFNAVAGIWPTLLIGTVLAIKDLVSWINGGNSVLGEFAEKGQGAGGVVGALSQAIYSLREGIEAVIATGVIDEIVSVVTELLPPILGIIGEIGSAILSLVPSIASIIKIALVVISPILSILGKVIALIVGIGGRAFKTVALILSVLSPAFNKLAALLNWIAGLFGFVGEVVQSVFDAISAVMGKVFGWASEQVSAMVDEIVAAFTELGEWIDSQFANGVLGTIMDLVSSLLFAFGELGAAIQSALSPLLDLLGSENTVNVATRSLDRSDLMRRSIDQTNQATTNNLNLGGVSVQVNGSSASTRDIETAVANGVRQGGDDTLRRLTAQEVG